MTIAISRELLKYSLIGTLLFAVSFTSQAQLFKKKKPAQPQAPAQTKLQPGQFEWHPEKAPSGPLLVVVSIDDQMVYVYRNSVQIGRSTASTGRPGKETPTGVFSILQKNKDHESSIYKGAKMPNMQRLTWSGIALHAGDLPGYPASAGCIRLPLQFSELLFAQTEMGATVAITQRSSYPSESGKPVEILQSTKVDPSSVPIPTRQPFWDPSKSSSGPVAVLISLADKTTYIFRNGTLIGQAPIAIVPGAEEVPGGLFLMLDGVVEGQNPIVPDRPMRPWSILTLDASERPSMYPLNILRSRIRINPDFLRNVHDLLTPGTLMLVTKDSSNSDTRSDRGFVIMNPDGSQ
tara:strand:- start:1638 stop:2684 length:1047 start_codon:yes stop_codon:yes gene_type:complete